MITIADKTVLSYNWNLLREWNLNILTQNRYIFYISYIHAHYDRHVKMV